MRAHPVSGQTVAAETKPMGMFTRRPLACVRRIEKKNKKHSSAGVQARGASTRLRCFLSISWNLCDLLHACTHMREMCLSRVFCRCIFRPRDNLLFSSQPTTFLVLRACVFAVHNYYCWTFECRKAMTIIIIITMIIVLEHRRNKHHVFVFY